MTEDAAALPAGTVSFLLTDIEGSTRRWEEHGPAMTAAVGRHYEILDLAVRAHGGVRPIEQGEGDSMVAAFTRATDAVAAALDAQLRLAAEPWPEGAPLAVRMALHTGEAQIREEKYYAGPSIIRCARLRALGHGGQVLISGTTADLLSGGLPDSAALIPLGVHRLRDLVAPQRVFQLTHPGLRPEFPPLNSLDVLPNNLPAQLTSFVGREREAAEIADLTEGHRLLTLVGPGGCGKTRLAARSAAESLPAFPAGVWWIDLSTVTDPALVPLAVMHGVGLGDDRGLDPIDRVAGYLTDQQVRLVLDNCEHVSAAAARVVDALLRACPSLAVLATSREPLGVPGEVTWRAVPLSLPDPDGPASAVAEAEAVQLFVERCVEARPSFVLTPELAPTVAAICVRLDGLPLAIELAAARVRSLSPQRILTELSDRFRLLTGGARTALARQQTLQASVEWSHHLLGDTERLVFRRLAVCAKGFDLEAAEAVAVGGPVEGWEVLDVLADLVDKSLVTFDGDRYGLLQTIAEFAGTQLLASGESDEVRDKHAAHFLARVEAADDLLTREVRSQAVDALEADHDNLRAALEWTAARAGDDAALRFVVALASFWYVRGHYTEGLAWHRRVLAQASDETTPMRCRVVASLGQLSLNCAEISNGLGYADVAEAVHQARALGDPGLLARPLAAAARYEVFGLPGDPAATLAEALVAARAAGDEWAVSNVLFWQAFYWIFNRNRPEAAESALAELDAIAVRADSVSCRGWNAVLRGVGYWYRGRIPAARAALDSAHADGVLAGDILLESYAIGLGTQAAIDAGDYAHAEASVLRTAARVRRLDACRQGVVDFGLIHVALARGDFPTAARLVDEIADLVHSVGLPFFTEWLCWAQGTLSLVSGDLAMSRAAFAEAVASAETTGIPVSLAVAQLHVAMLSRAEGDAPAAETALHRALTVVVEHGLRGLAVDVLEGLGSLAAAGNSCAEAARLFGAAAALREVTGRVRPPIAEPAYAADVAGLADRLGTEGFERAFAEGAALGLAEAAAYVSRARGERKRPANGWAALTPTELEVAALAATGASNAQIGAALFISPATAKTHLQHIYAKLGVANRAALAAVATARSTAQI